ncbi:hypothetical protein FQR65_LT04535 [Abscondita terminalis]|nr:hypothetical protein FQR65_LT04535 [Abscondita terminalis]
MEIVQKQQHRFSVVDKITKGFRPRVIYAQSPSSPSSPSNPPPPTNNSQPNSPLSCPPPPTPVPCQPCPGYPTQPPPEHPPTSSPPAFPSPPSPQPTGQPLGCPQPPCPQLFCFPPPPCPPPSCCSDKVCAKFSVSWNLEGPGCISESSGWQVEFTDAPGVVHEKCQNMVDWVCAPPLQCVCCSEDHKFSCKCKICNAVTNVERRRSST